MPAIEHAFPGDDASAYPIRLRRLAVRYGAAVSGIDFSRPISSAQAQALRAALDEHAVLLFDAADLGAQAYFDFAAIFGQPVLPNPYQDVAGNDAVSSLTEVLAKRPANNTRNDVWHIDNTYTPAPPRFTALLAREVPEIGGDTMWSHAVQAFESFPPLFRAYLESLTAVNSLEATGLMRSIDEPPERLEAERRKFPPLEVPVIRHHTDIGRKQIYVNELVTGYIRGLSRVESQNILGILFDRLKSPDLQLRHAWRPGDLAIWDNRQVQHRGVLDYAEGARVLHRIAVL